MRLKVIEGGLSTVRERDDEAESGWPNREDVRREARRRLGASGYHRSRAMEYAAGVPMLRTIIWIASTVGILLVLSAAFAG